MGRIGIFLTFIASLGSISAQDIKIKPNRDVHVKPVNGQVVFTCLTEGVGPDVDPDLKWYNGGGDLITDKTGRRLYIEQVGNQELKLYITKIDNADAGRYTCEGRISGNIIEKYIQLELYKDITFDSAPTPQHPKIFSDATIECIVSGQPIPTVSWKYGQNVIQPGNRYVITETGLFIKNITEEDNGMYQCRAEVQNDGRLDMREIEVIVHIPPKITESPGTVEGIEQHEVSFECKASGKPAPKWEFFKDGSEQPLSSTDTRIVDTNAGVIHFRPLHRDEDGDYECVALNDVGQDSAFGKLSVIVPPRILEYNEVFGEENKGTTITCQTEGNPPPEMIFKKVGNDYDYVLGDNENGRIVVQKVDERKATLTINNLQPSDTANYTCTCKNSGGLHALNSTITVHYTPRFSEDHITEVYSWAGKIRNMTCHAIAEPEPFIDWVLFGNKLKNNETYRIYPNGRRSDLQITVREEDQGWIFSEYSCEATNQYGTGVQKIRLLRATVPDQPEEVAVKEDSPTMVILTVVPPEDDGGVAIASYRVEYDQHVQDFNIESRQELRIEKLRPSTTYIFRVRAKNEVGVGNAKEISHTTKQISQPYAIIITSDPVGRYAYEYTVHWEKPKTGGLPIQEYKIQYRRVKVDGDGRIIEPLDKYIIEYQTDNPDKPWLYYRIEGLKPETHYQVIIQARNDVGWSVENSDFAFLTAYGDGNVGQVSGGERPSPSLRTLLGMHLLLFLIGSMAVTGL